MPKVFSEKYLPDLFFLPQRTRNHYIWEPYGMFPTKPPPLSSKQEILLHEQWVLGSKPSNFGATKGKYQDKSSKSLCRLTDDGDDESQAAFSLTSSQSSDPPSHENQFAVAKKASTELALISTKKNPRAEKQQALAKKAIEKQEDHRHQKLLALNKKDELLLQKPAKGPRYVRGKRNRLSYDLRVTRVLWALEHHLCRGHVVAVAQFIAEFCRDLERSGIAYQEKRRGYTEAARMQIPHTLTPRAYLSFFQLVFEFAQKVPEAKLLISATSCAIADLIPVNPEFASIGPQMVAFKVDALIAAGRHEAALEFLVERVKLEQKYKEKKFLNRGATGKDQIFKSGYHLETFDIFLMEEVPFLGALAAFLDHSESESHSDLAIFLMLEREICPPITVWRRYFQFKKDRPKLIKKMCFDAIQLFGPSPFLLEQQLIAHCRIGKDLVKNPDLKCAGWEMLLGEMADEFLESDNGAEFYRMWEDFALTCDVPPDKYAQNQSPWRFLKEMPADLQLKTLFVYLSRKPDCEYGWQTLANVIAQHPIISQEIIKNESEKWNILTNLFDLDQSPVTNHTSFGDKNRWNHLYRYMLFFANFLFSGKEQRGKFYLFLHHAAKQILELHKKNTWPPVFWDARDTFDILHDFLKIAKVKDTPAIPLVFGYYREASWV